MPHSTVMYLHVFNYLGLHVSTCHWQQPQSLAANLIVLKWSFEATPYLKAIWIAVIFLTILHFSTIRWGFLSLLPVSFYHCFYLYKYAFQDPPSFKVPLVDIVVEEGVDKVATLQAEFSVKNPRIVKWQRVCLLNVAWYFICEAYSCGVSIYGTLWGSIEFFLLWCVLLLLWCLLALRLHGCSLGAEFSTKI